MRDAPKPGAMDIPGPHQLDQAGRTQAALEGPSLHLGGRRSVIVIRDADPQRWAIYPGGDPREAFWCSHAEMADFAARILRALISDTPGGDS